MRNRIFETDLELPLFADGFATRNRFLRLAVDRRNGGAYAICRSTCVLNEFGMLIFSGKNIVFNFKCID